jgi:hypothetical protein
MIGKKVLCPKCNRWNDTRNLLAPKCWNCGYQLKSADILRPMRSDLLKPKLEIKNALDIRSGVMRSIPGVKTGTPGFYWGFKPHTVDYGKGRPVSEDEIKRQAEIVGTIRGYTGLIAHLVQEEMYIPYWFRFLYKPRYERISNLDRRLQYMKGEDSWLYGRLVGRSIRTKAKTSIYSPPVMLSCLDLPVPKREKISLAALRLQGNNDGWHTCGFLCQPPNSRIKKSYVDHFKDNEDVYTEGGIAKVDVVPIEDDIRDVCHTVIDYMLKTAKRHREVNLLDYVELYPKARSELRG